MRRPVIVIVACVLLLLLVLSTLLWRIKSGIPLIANGKVVAVAKQSLFLPWHEGELSVYIGKTKAFGVWEDFFDYPVFIYPFSDGKRFLCIDNDDTSVLIYVVDLNASATRASLWPPDNYARTYIFERMTNVVMDTKGIVRLPTYPELQDAASYLANPELKNDSIGVYSAHWSVQKLLSELDSNRVSVWP